MRPIKFRAWDKENKRMLVDFFISSEGKFGELLWEQSGVLMQFTGLLDKNKTEVYEKDLVIGNYRGERLDMPAVVRWHGYGFKYQMPDGSWEDLNAMDDLQVIGNIYENRTHKKYQE